MASTDIASPDFSADAVVADIRAKNVDAQAESSWSGLAKNFGKSKEGGFTQHFIMNLPRNVSVGIMDAAINTADAIGATGKELSAEDKSIVDSPARRGSRFSITAPGVPAHDFAEVRAATAAVSGFRDHLAANSDTSDQITQGVAQFAIPYAGFAKLFGVARGVGFAANLFGLTAADIATASTVLEPHAGRLADLVDLGKHTEGKLGAALNTIAPDGSLQSRYIDWMMARDNEGETEGRFKNVVDTLVTNAAVAGILKTAASTMRLARTAARNAPSVIGTGPVAGSPGAQGGHIAFHGSGQENITAFDASKIGTGQGAQSFGHGMYFAENPQTAGHYREMLSQTVRSPAMDEARAAIKAAGGDRAKAFAKLTADAANETDAGLREQMQKGAKLIKSGAARERGALYTVDIPDEHVGRMLKWDAPISEQPPSVQRAINSPTLLDNINAGREASGMARLEEIPETWTGEDLYHQISDHAVFSSALLNDLGVPGIRYLDQGSRAAGKGTHNIVVFDPKHVKILKKE